MSLAQTGEEITIQGTPVSPGIAIGPLHIIASGTISPEVYSITDHQINSEQQRFGKAVHATKRQLNDLREHILNLSGEEEAKIFEAHLMVLEDSSLIDRVLSAIKDRQQNAEYAFYAVMQNFLEAMRRVPDPYLRERTVDLEDVCQRVLRNFSVQTRASEADQVEHKHILVSHDLTPSDTASINRQRVLGLVTELGSVNSHTAILSRSLGIPAIVGLSDAVIHLKTLAPSILDGYTGKLIVNPSQKTIEIYRRLARKKEAVRARLEAMKDQKAVTTDGRNFILSANVEFNHELDLVKTSGAEGIGLYRTEFFLLNNEEMPSEAQQTEAYSVAVRSVAPHQVIFRTLDAGGDKLPVEPLAEPEPNPFLGWRGLRVSLSRQDMFKEQLRAILRASAHGKIGIMFPMVSTLTELKSARKILEECRAELTEQGVEMGENIEIGAMIEVPSAALIAHHIAKHVDFFSIGTNDLIQYTLAVDRVNHHVADLYKPAHPSVIQLIKLTVDASNKNKIWTGVCGEMASDLTLLPILVGLGVNELSTGTHQIPAIRQAIRSLSYKACATFVQSLENVDTSGEMTRRTLEFAQANYPDLLDNQ